MSHKDLSYPERTDCFITENVADLLSDGLAITSQDGFIKYSNKRFKELFCLQSNNKNSHISEIIPLPQEFLISNQYVETEIELNFVDGPLYLKAIKDFSPDINTEEINQIYFFKDITTIDKLKEKVLELNAFIYKVSHDLKAPLSSMGGILNLINIDKDSNMSSEYMNLLKKSIRRMDCILVDLLELSRVSSEKFEKTEVNLQNLLTEIIDSLNHLPNANHIKIYQEINKDLKVTIEKPLISSVLQNLIINAINYHNLKIIPPYIRIIARVDKGLLNIIISDNGPGINTELHEKVFDKFFRANTNTEGSGLGLHIVKSVVAKLKGKITMQSNRHSGTTFKMLIPVEEKI